MHGRLCHQHRLQPLKAIGLLGGLAVAAIQAAGTIGLFSPDPPIEAIAQATADVGFPLGADELELRQLRYPDGLAVFYLNLRVRPLVFLGSLGDAVEVDWERARLLSVAANRIEISLPDVAFSGFTFRENVIGVIGPRGSTSIGPVRFEYELFRQGQEDALLILGVVLAR